MSSRLQVTSSSSSSSSWQGIKYVMIPEGMRDFHWLNSLLKGEKISSDPYKDIW